MTGGRGAFLRVGLLVALGGGVALALVWFLGGDRIRNGVVTETYFQESVQGLEIGAPVKFRGVTLGQVTAIGLVSAIYFQKGTVDLHSPTTRLVYVDYVVDATRTGAVGDTPSLVRAGLRAKLASQGLTGLAYIELDFFDPEQFPVPVLPWQPRFDFVPSVPSTFAQVQDAAQTLLSRINAIDLKGLADKAQRVLDDIHGQLTDGDAQQALAGAAALTKAAKQGLDGADLPGLVADLRGTLAGVRGLVSGSQSKEALAATTRAADRLADTAAKLPALVTALEAAVHRTSSGVTDLQADLVPVLRDARAAASNLRETTEALRRYPAGALFGGPPPREEPR